MPKKLIKLELPPESAQYFALSSHEALHKLAWQINSNLGLQLKESNDIVIADKSFPIQKDEDTLIETSIALIKNRIEGTFLVRELQNVDYIAVLKGTHLDKNAKIGRAHV